METIINKEVNLRKQLEDVALDISWAKISQKYFGKSASWIYHKFDGIDGNGNKGGFTPEEKEQFKAGLYDLAERIMKTADKL